MHEWDHPPIFWVFNSPSPRPQGPMGNTGGGGTSADIVPIQIIFGVGPCKRCWEVISTCILNSFPQSILFCNWKYFITCIYYFKIPIDSKYFLFNFFSVKSCFWCDLASPLSLHKMYLPLYRIHLTCLLTTQPNVLVMITNSLSRQWSWWILFLLVVVVVVSSSSSSSSLWNIVCLTYNLQRKSACFQILEEIRMIQFSLQKYLVF